MREREGWAGICTTIAVVLPVLAAQSNQPTLLIDTLGDAAPTLGLANPPRRARSSRRSPTPSNHTALYASPRLEATGSTPTQWMRAVSWSQPGIA